jgi:hypothetical protein
MTFYKLDENNNPVECSLEEWRIFYADEGRRTIRVTRVGEWLVSTRFIGNGYLFLTAADSDDYGAAEYLDTFSEAEIVHNDLLFMIEHNCPPRDGWLRNSGIIPQTTGVIQVLWSDGRIDSHGPWRISMLEWSTSHTPVRVVAYKFGEVEVETQWTHEFEWTSDESIDYVVMGLIERVTGKPSPKIVYKDGFFRWNEEKEEESVMRRIER